MYLMIDNYDSFVYNLIAYLEELNEDIIIVRNDEITVEKIENIKDLKGIIISPGPKNPDDCGICREIVKTFAGKIPILGVCLGHQIIGAVFGAEIIKGPKPVHGKVENLYHKERNLFKGLKNPYKITRYHSLVINRKALPEILEIDAETEDGQIMAVTHKKFPVYGVQFHPEAVLTEYGHELLRNFTEICRNYKK